MEVYKDIKGYEGLYKVSNYGNVFSIISNKNLVLCKMVTNNTTYRHVDLVKDKIKSRKSVHRLVAETFLSNPSNKPCVNHLDNNGSNNHVTNLEWCTYSENLRHAQTQGRLYEAQRKGGIAATEKAKAKAKEEAEGMVNQVYGTQKVLEHLGVKKVGTKGDVYRHYFRCSCTKCGNETEILRESLKADKISCKFCSDKKKTLDRYTEIQESLINTKINNWTILQITEPLSTIRTCKLHIQCTCGNKEVVGYGKIQTIQTKKCRYCKQGSSHFASLEATS